MSEDSKIFRELMKDVKPLKHDKVEYRPTPPKPKPKSRTEVQIEESGVEDELVLTDDFTYVGAEENLFFARSGLQIKLIRKLKRGQFPIEAKLDLHELTILESKQDLMVFLHQCQHQKMRHVCVVHGKGIHSAEKKAKLKSAVNSWLRRLDSVLAFCSAQPQDGGKGAVYVLLKRQREK